MTPNQRVEGALPQPGSALSAPDAPPNEATQWAFEEGAEIAAGRYALSLLGGGHRFEAYLAWDDELHHVVVAKLLRPHLVTRASALAGLRAEAEAIWTLQHPVLLRCFDLVTDGPRPHLVLEHLEGPRLSTLLRRGGRLAIEQVVPLGVQVASALVYMHNRGYVHLDVKPRNIIMGAPPQLIDLSVARRIEDARRAVDPIGTDAYMAPEQCRPAALGPMGPQSDVWGWGVTMYEALTGATPFPRVSGATSESDRFPQLHLEPAPFPKDIPPPLRDLVGSCLRQRPEERPDQRDVTAELETLMAALPRRIVLSRLRPRIR
jgi:serine/threonine protein kinase